MNRAESRFQAHFIKLLRRQFPGSIILKNDPNYLQGVPDVLLLWREHWAAFECKSSENASTRPNQREYVLLMDAMSFSSFVFPKNVDKVLHEVQLAFQARRTARISERQQVSLDQLRRRKTNRSLDQRSSRQTRNGTSRSSTSSNTSRR